jgi:hypothetical protein
MGDPLLRRIPIVAGLAYIERLNRLPSPLNVTLKAERDNRYFPHAIAVTIDGQRLGYVAPEVARRFHAALLAQPTPLTCPARRASVSDHQTSGVELILDFSGLAVEVEE